VVAERARSVQSPGREVPLADQLTFHPEQLGIFKVVLRYQAGAEVQGQKDLVTFAVLPRALVENPPNPNSAMGLHAYPNNWKQGRKLGACWFRLHGIGNHFTYWNWVQPTPDQWVWYDPPIDQLRADGYFLLGLLGFGARWAAKVPASEPPPVSGSDEYRIGRYPPQDLQQWAAYVERTVAHYRGRIDAWEVWNEPDVPLFWQGTPQEYVQLLQTAYRAAKKVHPNCVILGGGGAVSKPWIREIFQAGALQSMDAFSIHGYWDDALTALRSTHYPQRMAALRQLMREYGREVPIWNTEGGTPNTTFYDDLDFPLVPPPAARDLLHYQEAGHEIVKRWANVLAAGVVRDFYYYAGWTGAGDPNQTYEVYESSNLFNEFNEAPRPHAVAYGIFAYLVDGGRFLEDLDWGEPWVTCHVFERDGRLVATVWADGLDDDRARLVAPLGPGQIEVLTVMGNCTPKFFVEGRLRLPLDERPFYLLGRPGALQTTWQKLRDSRIVR
jgi:hypothetical protein